MFRRDDPISSAMLRVPPLRGSVALVVALIVAMAALTTPTAQAATRVDLTPGLAYFNPLANAVDEGGATAKFANGLGFGGRISIWLNDSVALEAAGAYFGSSLDGAIAGESAGSIDANLFYGSAQIAIGLGPERRLLLHGGFGFQGTTYNELIDGGTIATGVIGLGGWIPLNQTVALRADLDAYLHTLYYEFAGARTQDQTQIDTVFTVGLQFSPGGR